MSGLTKILLICQLFLHIKGYRPVILVHGLFGGKQTWPTTIDYIQKDHPGLLPVHIIICYVLFTPEGTNITVVKSYEHLESVTTDLWTQVKGVYKEIHPLLVNAPDGVILYCYSQGIR